MVQRRVSHMQRETEARGRGGRETNRKGGRDERKKLATQDSIAQMLVTGCATLKQDSPLKVLLLPAQSKNNNIRPVLSSKGKGTPCVPI